ncbi:hypothetical protein [Nocardioides sp.]|uniref:hypothetical protein n=1 Tax=Nocardioides sp. TaxID=35761 RepID=UPI002736E021|nr:hypothetical protein [Nocardioides sp.]MDP3891729.1 hypothetical protein [Nocardioides sp.]
MVALIPLLVIGAVVVLAVALRQPDATAVDVNAEWRRVLIVRAAALGAGVVTAYLAHTTTALGRGTMLAPALVGLGVVVGVALGETLVRPPRPDGVRTASLAPRRVRDHVPSGLAVTVLTAMLLHAVTLVVTSVSASADDLGRAGRQLAHTCGDVTQARGPYPGSFYSLPLAATLLAIALVTAAALVVVVRRPRGFSTDDAGDDLLRRRSATTVLAAFGASVTASHAGIAFYAGVALRGMECGAPWMRPAGVALLVSVPVAVVLTGWLLGRVFTPDRPR